MKTTLRLELPPLQAMHGESRVAFALLDRLYAIQRSGELALSELAQAIPPCRIEAILHPSDAVLTSVVVPPLPSHRLGAAVLGAVEPLLLGDIDTLAVAHGERAADGTVAVAWAPRELLSRALQTLADCRLSVDALIPAPLALPLTDSAWTAVLRDAQIVVRTGPHSGYCWATDPLLGKGETDPAAMALQLAIEQETPSGLNWIEPLPAAELAPQGIELGKLPADSRWRGPKPGWSLALADLRPRQQSRSPWFRPLAWAAAAAAVWLLGLNVHAWQLGREEVALRQRMTAQVKAAFPDLPVILDPLRQAEQRRDALRAAGGTFGDSDFLPLALASTQLLPQASSNVVTLSFSSGELRLRLVDDAIGMISKTVAPPAPQAQIQRAARRLTQRASPNPAQPGSTPAPALPQTEIDPEIVKRAQTLGLNIDRIEGEWRIRTAGAAGAETTTQRGGVRIQQDVQAR